VLLGTLVPQCRLAVQLSTQAKGWVKRIHRVLQDRLTKKLRRKKIANSEANGPPPGPGRVPIGYGHQVLQHRIAGSALPEAKTSGHFSPGLEIAQPQARDVAGCGVPARRPAALCGFDSFTGQTL